MLIDARGKTGLAGAAGACSEHSSEKRRQLISLLLSSVAVHVSNSTAVYLLLGVHNQFSNRTRRVYELATKMNYYL